MSFFSEQPQVIRPSTGNIPKMSGFGFSINGQVEERDLKPWTRIGRKRAKFNVIHKAEEIFFFAVGVC